MKSFMILSCNFSFFYFTMPFGDFLFLFGYQFSFIFITILLICSFTILNILIHIGFSIYSMFELVG